MLTPYVVRTPADLARMSQDERGRAAHGAARLYPERVEPISRIRGTQAAAATTMRRPMPRRRVNAKFDMITVRSWAVYGMLAAIWGALIAWQVAEHSRRQQATARQVD